MNNTSDRTRMRPWVALVSRCGLVGFGLVVSWIVLEALFRLTGAAAPVELGQTFDRPEHFYKVHPTRRHPWVTGHPDPLRIAVIGDSFTDGQSNHEYDAYPSRLEALLNLNEGQRPAQVRTYARRGSSTPSQLAFLARALKRDPQIVILGIFLNDTERPADTELRRMRRTLRPNPPTGRLAWVLRRSHSLAWIYQRFENTRSARGSVRYYRHIYDPEYEGFQNFDRAIRGFRDTTRRHGAELLTVIFPAMSTLGPNYRFHFAHERLQAVLDSHKVKSLDLLEAFSSTLPARMAAFPNVDPHPSEIAHRIAADAILERLIEGGMIDDGYRPRNVESKPRRKWLEELRRMKDVVHLAPQD